MEFNFVRHETGKKYAKNYTTSDDINAFDDSGIVIPENIIIVDIDTLPKNKIISLLKIFNIKTQIVWTERGIHLYFKKPRYYRSLHGSGFISLGFNVEYKHNKNTKSITIKRNGILRKIENQGNFEEFPEIFKKINDSSENLSMIGINHDRNNRLYSHKFKIIGKVSEYKKCLQFINQYLFEEPLPDKEFEVVSREEKVIAEKNGESKIAEVIAVDKKIKLYNGDLYFYNGVYYEKDLLELKKIVGLEYCYMKNTRYIDEVIKQLEYIFAERILDSKSFAVKLKNGVLKDGLFIPSEYDDFTPFYIDHEYIPETKKVPEIEEFLNFITDNDQGYINLLLEMMAYCLVTDPYFIKKLSKFFLIVGKGGNGKGTLITIVQLILGKNNYSTVPFHKFTDITDVYPLYGKLANFDDDLMDQPINKETMKMLKNISTSDTISIRQFYKHSFSTRLITTLIGSSNHEIKSYEKSESYKRRVIWLPMYNSLVKYKNNNTFFHNLYQTKESMDYWIKLIIDAYERLYKQQKFTESETVSNYNKDYHMQNDNTIKFIHSLGKENILNAPVSEVKEWYKNWCESENFVPLQQRILNDSIEFEFGLVKRNTVRNGHNGWKYVER